MTAQTSPQQASGFTLIEILVVVVVVSILMSVVVASFTGTGREQELQGYVERLALRLEMARDKALQRNREWGVYFEDEGVRFAEFDEVNGQWTEYTQRPFVAERYGETVELKVTVEEFTALTDSDEDDELPSIVLYSSGETTPFTVDVTPRDWTTRPWHLATDGFTRITPTRDE